MHEEFQDENMKVGNKDDTKNARTETKNLNFVVTSNATSEVVTNLLVIDYDQNAGD